MKLASLRTEAGIVAAAVVGDEIVDLSVAAPQLPDDVVEILALGPTGAEAVQQAVESGAGRAPLDLQRLESPVLNPPKFIAIGKNYIEHVREIGEEMPTDPTVFAKWNNTIAAPYAEVQVPAVSDKLDFECELGVVIGRRAKHVSKENAASVIAGFTVINDYSVRDYQMRGGQWVLGKSFDGHGVVGPWVITPDEVDPHNLPIRTIVNGEVRQESNTKNLIFDVYTLIAELSSAATLEPGDLIATGTPGGVGVMEGRYLAPGDVVRVEIDGIGAIENVIVQEPPPVERIEAPSTLYV
ncbi:fumarylacetoacetate hydrolase family protein [Microbacterium timonense]|uniref:fumarylacetoacetate hydrolase family protein n=1 Tax=Microbacterium timonense TaxID=2086576 RepID=UPI000D113488|nr:fumarylacetoacetate hydrolase family protein [Microbacterium timonense]